MRANDGSIACAFLTTMINSSMITYPRKCQQCEYIANNPAMFSYHKKTHQPIPKNAECHFGCGCKATHRNTGGKLTCKEKYQECSAYLEQLTERTKQSWQGADARKSATKKLFEEQVVFNEEARKKGICVIKSKAILFPEDAKDYRAYARKCRKISQEWAKENGYKLGQQTLHVDHKLSILESYYAGLSVEVVSHPANLQVIDAKLNSAKGSNSILTVPALLELIENSSDPVS